MSRLTRRGFLGRAASATAAAALASCATTRPAALRGGRPPNVLFVLTDDQRYNAVGCMGNRIIHTPNMDALAADGTLFLNHFVTTPICCTSRASIFTGMYARSHGIHDFATDFPPDLLDITYPVLMRDAGYRTGFIGKYGVGTHMPVDRYDYFCDLPGTTQYFQVLDGRLRHLTGWLTDRAVDFIRGCDGTQPFCLSVSYRSPHSEDYDPRPYPADPAFDDLYRDATIPPPPLADPRYFEALPAFLRNSESRRRWAVRFRTPEMYQESVKDCYRMISGVDAGLGRILATLEQRGLSDDTMVVVTSDNGAFLGDRGLADKWYAYEASIRTPLIVHGARWPYSLRGRTVREMTLNIDLAPTLLEEAGVPVPARMQGRSLSPLLRGRPVNSRRDWYFEHLFPHPLIPRSEGVRTRHWKYFRWIDADPLMEEMYDLRGDPDEVHNLAGVPAHRPRLEELRALYTSWKDRLPEAPYPRT